MDCRRCHKEMPEGDTVMLTCLRCKSEAINEELDVAYGVKKVDTIKGGVEITAYETVGDECFKFPSWYCGKFFESQNEREEHDKKYHKVGDFMMGCIPTGFSEGFKQECGD